LQTTAVYSTTTPESNDRAHAPRPGRSWTARQRLAWTWNRNPWFSGGAHARRRYRMEAAVARLLVEREALVVMLRKRARNSAQPEALHAAAERLAMITPEGLGLIHLDHARPGGGKRALPYYIPDVAMPVVAAALRLWRWSKRLIDREARQAYAAQLRRVAAHLGAVVRDALCREQSRPIPDDRERERETLSLSRTSDRPESDWLKEIIARRCAGGGEEVR
jgi:hypothetical protein